MKILLVANTDWFLYRFNAELARSLRRAGAEVVLVSPEGEYSRRFEAEGFHWRRWHIERRRLLPWQELPTCWALRSILHLEQPDLVHCFTLKAALYGAAMARWVGVEKVVHSITGLGYLYSSKTPRARWLRRCLVLSGRRLFPRSEMIFLNRDDLLEFQTTGLVGDGRGTVIGGSGVDVGRFTPQAWNDEAPPWVVLPARLLRSKGVEIFVRAAGQLNAQGINARFALVGPIDVDNPDGIPNEQIERWCRDLGVELWGFRDDMISVYRQASIVCLPSFYREGVPTVLLEAAACGRPIVTTDMPGCRDAVVDGQSGHLVPAHDVDALIEALGALLGDRGRCRRMGRVGRQHVVDTFSVEQVIEATFGVYRRCGLDLDAPSSDSAVEPQLRLGEDAANRPTTP